MMMSKTGSQPDHEEKEDETKASADDVKDPQQPSVIEKDDLLLPEIAVSPSIYSATAKLLLDADIIGICYKMLE